MVTESDPLKDMFRAYPQMQAIRGGFRTGFDALKRNRTEEPTPAQRMHLEASRIRKAGGSAEGKSIEQLREQYEQGYNATLGGTKSIPAAMETDQADLHTLAIVNAVGNAQVRSASGSSSVKAMSQGGSGSSSVKSMSQGSSGGTRAHSLPHHGLVQEVPPLMLMGPRKRALSNEDTNPTAFKNRR